jgi:hypothetical protein
MLKIISHVPVYRYRTKDLDPAYVNRKFAGSETSVS